MGASSVAGIGVKPHIYRWVGGWARCSVVVETYYVDPTVLLTPAAYMYMYSVGRQDYWMRLGLRRGDKGQRL